METGAVGSQLTNISPSLKSVIAGTCGISTTVGSKLPVGSFGSSDGVLIVSRSGFVPDASAWFTTSPAITSACVTV